MAVILLERETRGLDIRDLTLGGTPVTLMTPEGDRAPEALVIVAHGFGGSRQMMRALSIHLARSGLAVANLDLLGHGRTGAPMAGDVTRLDGATARLVEQIVATTGALRRQTGLAAPVALLGHSMASDVVIRAAARLPETRAVAVLSMYSEAVTATAPDRLLILSGAQERRLRGVAVEALQRVVPSAQEGETARAGVTERRAVAVPWVGHVGVLYAADSQAETLAWIADSLDRPLSAPISRAGPLALVLLGALLALAWPLAHAAGQTQPPPTPLPRKTAALALAAPVLPALLAAILTPHGALGLLAFSKLAAFFGTWGLVQGAILWRRGDRLPRPRLVPALIFAGWAFGLFALALDRYGGAFLPTGPRLGVMALLLVPAILFISADAVLTRGNRLWLRLTIRLVPLATLLGAMILSPLLGVAYTVLVVVTLYWLAFGLAARWFAARAGAGTTALVLAPLLAWSLAATTPMIASQGGAPPPAAEAR